MKVESPFLFSRVVFRSSDGEFRNMEMTHAVRNIEKWAQKQHKIVRMRKNMPKFFGNSFFFF